MIELFIQVGLLIHKNLYKFLQALQFDMNKGGYRTILTKNYKCESYPVLFYILVTKQNLLMKFDTEIDETVSNDTGITV